MYKTWYGVGLGLVATGLARGAAASHSATGHLLFTTMLLVALGALAYLWRKPGRVFITAGLAVAGGQGLQGHVMGVSVLADAFLALVVAFWARPRKQPGLYVSDGFFAIVLFVLVSAALSLGLAPLTPGQPQAVHNLTLLLILYLATPPVEVFVTLLVLSHARSLRAFIAENYRSPRALGRQVGYGLAGGVALSLLTGVIVGLEQQWLRIQVMPNNPFVFSHSLRIHWAIAVGIAVAVVIMAPIAEEALFRGILFGSLARIWPYPVASLVSAVMFGAAHLNATLLVPLAIAGGVLNAIYWRTRSLIPSTVAHATLNGLSVAMAFLALSR